MKKTINCPSSYISAGSKVFMVKDENDDFQPIDFVDIDSIIFEGIKDYAKILEKIRVTNPCSTKCLQWSQGKCQVINKNKQYVNQLDSALTESRFNKCKINDSCRWYIQHGLDACAICSNFSNDVIIC